MRVIAPYAVPNSRKKLPLMKPASCEGASAVWQLAKYTGRADGGTLTICEVPRLGRARCFYKQVPRVQLSATPETATSSPHKPSLASVQRLLVLAGTLTGDTCRQ